MYSCNQPSQRSPAPRHRRWPSPISRARPAPSIPASGRRAGHCVASPFIHRLAPDDRAAPRLAASVLRIDRAPVPFYLWSDSVGGTHHHYIDLRCIPPSFEVAPTDLVGTKTSKHTQMLAAVTHVSFKSRSAFVLHSRKCFPPVNFFHPWPWTLTHELELDRVKMNKPPC